MDKEEFIEKACQELFKLGGNKREVAYFRKCLEMRTQNRKEIKGETPKEAAEFWAM